MRMTDASISAMPATRRSVKTPLKTITDMQTAVTGSRAPIMAVGVEPAYAMPMFKSVMAIIVGTKATIKTSPNDCKSGIGITRLPGIAKDHIRTAMAAKSII